MVPSCHGDFSVLKKDKTDTLAVFESETGRQTVDAVFFVVIKSQPSNNKNGQSRTIFKIFLNKGLLYAFSLGQKLKTYSSIPT